MKKQKHMSPAELIRRELSAVPIKEGFSFRDMRWLTDTDSPLSRRIANELAWNRTATFNKVMGAALSKGMEPLTAEDWGVFVSWSIINFPIGMNSAANVTYHAITDEVGGIPDDAGKIHLGNGILLGCWDIALCKKDLDMDSKIALGRRLSEYCTTGGNTQAVQKFINDVGGKKRAQEIMERAIILDKVSAKEEVNDRPSDKKLLTEQGYKAAKRQGWHHDRQSYVGHIYRHAWPTVINYHGLLKADVGRINASG